MTEDKGQQDNSGELMYVKCAYCRKWMDVKPGHMNWVSHGLCDDCLKKELEKIQKTTPPSDTSPGAETSS